MRKVVYYSTADVERLMGVSQSTAKRIAGSVSKINTTFAAKERGDWRFTRREMCFVLLVSSIMARKISQDAAIAEVLEYFNGIDCKRDY